MVKGMDLRVLILIVGRSSGQFSSPPRNTLGRDVEDGLISPEVVWTVIRNMYRWDSLIKEHRMVTIK